MKKLPKLLICLGLTGSILFSGCSLVQRNTDRFLTRVVATCGEITVTKQELLNAYNSYGYQYVSVYGQTTRQAVDRVLGELLNKKIMYKEAQKYIEVTDQNVKYYPDGDKTGEGVLLFNKNVWQNDVWNSAFDSVNSQIKDFEKTIKKELKITDSEDEDEKKPEFEPYKEYEKKVEYENGEWKLVNKSLAPAEEKALSIGDFVQEKYGNSDVAKRAFKRYVNQLRLNNKYKNLTVKSLGYTEEEFDALYADLDLTAEEKVAFLYELDRLHTYFEESKYVSELENAYEKYNQTLDQEFNKQIVGYYKNLVINSYQKYASLSREQAYKKYFSDMQDDPSKVFYHGYGDTSYANAQKGFVKIAHVLIKITDEQIAELKELDNLDLPKDEYKKKYDLLVAKFMSEKIAYARDEKGFDIEDTKYSVSDIYAQINQKLSECATLEQKAEEMNKFIHKFGQDSGSINAEHYYAANLYTDDSGDFDDKLVKAFADTSRQLASEHLEGGNWAEPVFVNQSNYSGFHIILNLGLYQNEIVGDLTKQQIENIDSTEGMTNFYLQKLYNTRMMIGTNKTYYDEMYDKLSKNNYSNFEKSVTDTTKQNLKVTYYVSAYSDML